MLAAAEADVRETERVTAGTLDPADWDGFRRQAHRMLDDMVDYVETIRTRPVWQAMPDAVRARLGRGLPVGPMELSDVHAEFLRDVLPYALGNVHPGFMGWVHGGGTPVGMVAEMLAAGLNANVGGRDHAPVEIERQIAGWVREIFGFPEGAAGLFVTGTSMANWIAVKAARDRAMGYEVRERGLAGQCVRLRAYGSAAVHGSVGKAMDGVGLGSDALRKVPVDARFRMDLRELERAIARDRQDGDTPFLVVGSAGTVDTGAVDELVEIAAICEREGIWFHVDGAYGALAVLARELQGDVKARLRGIARADSLAFDFHKWGQVPYDAGFVMVRNGGTLEKAFAGAAGYLAREERGMAAGAVWPCDLGPDLSRGCRALKVWFTLKAVGTEALGASIGRSCALAKRLEARIAETPELELMAPVELNVVCFRYRVERCSRPAVADRINRQIVVDLQECGSVAPSTTVIGGCVAIRAALVNHRTSEAEVETLIDQTLVFGRALTSAAGMGAQEPGKAELSMLRLALESVERRLGFDPQSSELLFQQACLLDHTGQSLEARTVYLELLEREPGHVGALNNLGNLLLSARLMDEARALYELAVAYHPEHLASRANLGNVLIKQGEMAAARRHFDAALQVNPEFRSAHAGLSFVLGDLGEPEQAAWHRRKAFADKCVVIAPYRGEKPPITVLELVSTTGGNMRTDEFLSDRVFQRILVTTEFFNANTVLPPHQMVLNAVGEADGAAEALAGALAVVGRTTAPVINAPAAVMATGRCDVARRLGTIAGVVTAKTVSLRREVLLSEAAIEVLAKESFTFPLLLRSPGFHGGEHFERVDTAGELQDVVAGLPGDELMVMEYLDARGRDGKCRKYRVMMVNGRLYPLHVAISERWKIHYFSADMAESEANRAEDGAFLNGMAGVLGARAMTALGAIQRTLGLDYGGIDFALSEQGDVLVFEANATMAVVIPEKDERWEYRRPAVERIFAAVWEMLLERSKADGNVHAA